LTLLWCAAISNRHIGRLQVAPQHRQADRRRLAGQRRLTLLWCAAISNAISGDCKSRHSIAKPTVVGWLVNAG